MDDDIICCDDRLNANAGRRNRSVCGGVWYVFEDQMSAEVKRPEIDAAVERPSLPRIATKLVAYHEDLYEVVDFLNRLLRNEGYVFGLAKSTTPDRLEIHVYHEEHTSKRPT